MNKLSKKEINRNKTKIVAELKKVQREGIDNLVDFLINSDFFTAPASTMFHGNYEGGLAQHSYYVYEAFREKNETYQLGLPVETIILTSIGHDFDKIGKYEPNILKKGQSSAKPFKVNTDFPYGHGENSVRTIEKFVELTETEALLIRWHMGMYDKEYETYEKKLKEFCPALTAFQCADREVSAYIA